jgi:ribosome biogenesis GTPase
MVGDWAEISVLSGTDGVLEKVLPRRTYLNRPPVANVDQVVIVCSPQSPPLSLQILDRLLVLAEVQGLGAVICLNKTDLADTEAELDLLKDIYRAACYPVLATSALDGRGIDRLGGCLSHKISVVAGQSGVGKSSLLNRLQEGFNLRTGDVSERLRKGRHTTRHVELLPLAGGGMVADTPGFSQLDLADVSAEQLGGCFPELEAAAAGCRFQGCRHRSEPECAVKEEVKSGCIAGERYRNYLAFLVEIEERERSRFNG